MVMAAAAPLDAVLEADEVVLVALLVVLLAVLRVMVTLVL